MTFFFLNKNIRSVKVTAENHQLVTKSRCFTPEQHTISVMFVRYLINSLVLNAYFQFPG